MERKRLFTAIGVIAFIAAYLAIVATGGTEPGVLAEDGITQVSGFIGAFAILLGAIAMLYRELLSRNLVVLGCIAFIVGAPFYGWMNLVLLACLGLPMLVGAEWFIRKIPSPEEPRSHERSAFSRKELLIFLTVILVITVFGVYHWLWMNGTAPALRGVDGEGESVEANRIFFKSGFMAASLMVVATFGSVLSFRFAKHTSAAAAILWMFGIPWSGLYGVVGFVVMAIPLYVVIRWMSVGSGRRALFV